MPLIHPDKIVGVTRAILQRPRNPRPSVAVAAQRVAAGRPLAPIPQAKLQAEPGIVENLAFQLRDAHQAQHMNRMARMVDSAVANNKPVGHGPGPRNPKNGGPLNDPAMKGLRGPLIDPAMGRTPVLINIGGQHPQNEKRAEIEAHAARLAAEFALNQGR